MRSIACAALIFLAAGVVQGERSTSPPDPYISKGACPFECCTYREWIANRDLTVMDKPNGKPMAQLRKHEHVSANTGEIETHPLRFQIRQKGPDKEAVSIPVGSTVYLLHPVGEGFWLVWFRGKVIEMDPVYVGPGPRYQWWARIKIQSGQVGWVRMNVNDLPFDQVDKCA
jgi:hypothetical protein